MGRPSAYSDDIAALIIERLAAGESLRAICTEDEMPSEALVRKWVIQDEAGFGAQYARARDVGLDVLADQCMEIADRQHEGTGAVARDRLRFDARRWYLSKLAPKRYGEKVVLGHSTEPGKPVVVAHSVTPETMAELSSLLSEIVGSGS